MDNEKKLEDSILRYTLANPGNIFHLSFAIIKQYGLKAAISNKSLSDFEGIDVLIEDSIEASKHFKNGSRIILSTIEALSMAYLTTYYKHVSKPGTDYLIGVDIEDKRSRQTERELYLSDGVLAEFYNNKPGSITPFQQVIAQNIFGRNISQAIQDEVLKSINSKIKRRDTYNNVSGLIISVLTSDATILIKQIIESCDLDAFTPTFLMTYHDDLSTCTVIHLDNNISGIEDLKSRSYKITPKLVRESTGLDLGK